MKEHRQNAEENMLADNNDNSDSKKNNPVNVFTDQTLKSPNQTQAQEEPKQQVYKLESEMVRKLFQFI